MATIILLRHAHSEKNARHIINHDPTKPYALTAKGREQAGAIAARLAHERIDEAFASRYPRAQETARLALGGRQIDVRVDERLDEINNGCLEGTTITQYHEAITHRVKQTPEGGETWEALKNRLRSFLGDMRRKKGTILVVSHGHPLSVMRGLIEGWDDQRMEHEIPDHDEILRYEL